MSLRVWRLAIFRSSVVGPICTKSENTAFSKPNILSKLEEPAFFTTGQYFSVALVTKSLIIPLIVSGSVLFSVVSPSVFLSVCSASSKVDSESSKVSSGSPSDSSDGSSCSSLDCSSRILSCASWS